MGVTEHKPLSEQQVYLFQWFLATENGADFSIQISQMDNVQCSMFFAGLLAVSDNTCRRHTPDSRRQARYSIGKQGKVVHTLRFCSKFPYGVFGKSACWGVSPIPTETMINHRATPHKWCCKITGQLIADPVIFLFPFAPVPIPKGGQYLPLQSEYLAFLFLRYGTCCKPYFLRKTAHHIQFAVL